MRQPPGILSPLTPTPLPPEDRGERGPQAISALKQAPSQRTEPSRSLTVQVAVPLWPPRAAPRMRVAPLVQRRAPFIHVSYAGNRPRHGPPGNARRPQAL